MHGVISLAVWTCLLAVVLLLHASCPQSVAASRAGAASPRVTFILQLASGAVTGLSPDTEVDVEVRAVPVSTTIDATTVVLQTDPSHLRVIGWVGGREFDQVLLPGTDLGKGTVLQFIEVNRQCFAVGGEEVSLVRHNGRQTKITAAR